MGPQPRTTLLTAANAIAFESTIHLDLQPEVEAQLTAEAQARGMGTDQYVEKIVQSRPMPQTADPRKSQSVSEAIDRILELCEDSHLDGLSIRDLINEGRKH